MKKFKGRNSFQKIRMTGLRRKGHLSALSVIATTILALGNVHHVQAAESAEMDGKTQIQIETSTEVEMPKEEVVDNQLTEETAEVESNDDALDEKESVDSEATEDVQEIKKVGNDPYLVIKEIDQDPTFGEEAYTQLQHLTENIGSRPAGTEAEARTGQYIMGYLKGAGYEVNSHEFEYDLEGEDKPSKSMNIIAIKKGNDPKELIIGAHYDSVLVEGNTGADDNGSGVSLLLETSKRILNQEVPYTVRFIFFGAEEVGLKGSTAYANQMTEEEINRTIGMVNIDSVIAGDLNYMYSGDGGAVWLRDQAFDLASSLGLNHVLTNTGEHSDFAYGETGNWSDHAPFNKLGIPIVYFESTDWTLKQNEDGEIVRVAPGTKSDEGYIQTKDHGRIYHTPNDNLKFIEENYPGRAQDSLKTFASILYHLVMNVTPPEEKVEEPEKVEDTEDHELKSDEAQTPSKDKREEENNTKSNDVKIIASSIDQKLPKTGMASTTIMISGAIVSIIAGSGMIILNKKD